MKATPESVWRIMHDYCIRVKGIIGKSDIVFNLNDENKNNYITSFKKTYDFILSNFMDSSSDKLDRHKQAAIAIYTLLENPIVIKNDFVNLMELRKMEKDNHVVFIGNEIVALSAGLQLLKQLLNYELKETSKKNNTKLYKIDDFYMPIPYYCDTPFFEVICRNLYFERKYIEKFFSTDEDRELPQYNLKKSLFILEFSNSLFLFEQLSLQKSGIDLKYLIKSNSGDNLQDDTK